MRGDSSSPGVGGIFAALTERELIDSDYYFGMTPVSTPSSPAERASVGWYVTLLPVTFPPAATSFDGVVELAQHAYENGLRLAPTSFQRVVELLPTDSDLDLEPGLVLPDDLLRRCPGATRQRVIRCGGMRPLRQSSRFRTGSDLDQPAGDRASRTAPPRSSS
ncbi:hypothetical protein [Nocardia sp. NPDC002869]|uniref:hypothetical protein n=1 Tax=Nocardia sp. NPDC002869 TaxID=3161032 RepID=UPI00398D1298